VERWRGGEVERWRGGEVERVSGARAQWVERDANENIGGGARRSRGWLEAEKVCMAVYVGNGVRHTKKSQ